MERGLEGSLPFSLKSADFNASYELKCFSHFIKYLRWPLLLGHEQEKS